MKPAPPQSEAELLARAQKLIGCTYQDLAEYYQIPLSNDSTKNKGSFGQLIEIALGAHSGSLAQPDFNHLGIELKTLPISAQGRSAGSTYICTAPLNTRETWENSRVFHKIAKILWVPYREAHPISARCIGAPFLWKLQDYPDIHAVLQQDWEELSEQLYLGEFENLSAHQGTYLQLRPKAAHARQLVSSINDQGEAISIVPKGFYLRGKLTNLIIDDLFY